MILGILQNLFGEFWIPRLFGERIVTEDDGFRCVSYSWCGEMYVVSITEINAKDGV